MLRNRGVNLQMVENCAAAAGGLSSSAEYVLLLLRLGSESGQPAEPWSQAKEPDEGARQGSQARNTSEGNLYFFDTF